MVGQVKTRLQARSSLVGGQHLAVLDVRKLGEFAPGQTSQFESGAQKSFVAECVIRISF